MSESYLICPECFSHNHFDKQEELEQQPCHNCQHPLLPVQPIEGSQQLFHNLVKQPMPLLVDFWGAWSGPCHELAPLFHDYADKYRGRVIFIKINSDDEQLLANQLQIRAFPTLLLFEHGKEVQRATGVLNANVLDKLLRRY